MAITLRLDEAETAEVREAARRAGKSMQAFAREAVLAAARDHERRRAAIVAEILSEDAEALDRLAQS
ncbi:ribbon-helix-helix protein, CopG family [Nocardioides pantholopis]|uniref:ribbon-helix-helix protein, CopG family n=1 Tax=Nocardioides pantholopis TaxID=2483798 RepID=UPI000FDB66C4|nr:ribbon-helix-helix protein, CopG family [Nocardioides pantholopis]